MEQLYRGQAACDLGQFGQIVAATLTSASTPLQRPDHSCGKRHSDMAG
jgi:hypothetical protein